MNKYKEFGWDSKKETKLTQCHLFKINNKTKTLNIKCCSYIKLTGRVALYFVAIRKDANDNFWYFNYSLEARPTKKVIITRIELFT